jgi:uncharacterized protein YraI
MKKIAVGLAGLLLIMMSVMVLQAQEFGTGWTANFYPNKNFQGNPVTVPNINGVNFNWPGAPVVNGQTPLGNQQDDFSVIFTSTQNFVAGVYRFRVSFDDELRVFIDGQQVYSGRLDPGISPKTESFDYTFPTTGPRALRLEYIEDKQSSVVQFQWGLIGTNVTPGPGTVFPTIAPTLTPIPPLTASVTGVRGLAVRTGPYLGATMITTAFPGNEYPVLARNPSEDGVTWYKITVNNRTGWSSGRYLSFNTSPDGLAVEGSVFDTLDAAPETGVTAAPRSIMNLRARPSTRTAIIGNVPWGAEMPLLGRTVQAGTDRWYQVRYNGQVGWIVAGFVTVRGDIRQVPIH